MRITLLVTSKHKQCYLSVMLFRTVLRCLSHVPSCKLTDQLVSLEHYICALLGSTVMHYALVISQMLRPFKHGSKLLLLTITVLISPIARQNTRWRSFRMSKALWRRKSPSVDSNSLTLIVFLHSQHLPETTTSTRTWRSLASFLHVYQLYHLITIYSCSKFTRSAKLSPNFILSS